MSRRILSIALGVAALGLAVALASGVVRDALVVPLLDLIWSLAQLIESLPQVVAWWVVVGAAIMLALRSLADTPTLNWPGRSGPQRGGRVDEWARAADLARHDPYARWRLAQRMALLATELIAYREGVDLRQARRIVEQSEELPPDVRAYLRAGFAGHRPAGGLLGRLRRTARAGDPLALDPVRAVEAIEQLAGQSES